MQSIRLITKIGGKALPRLCGTGKIPGGILHLSITAMMETVIGPIIRGMGLKINLMQNYSENSVTANSSLLSPRGGV